MAKGSYAANREYYRRKSAEYRAKNPERVRATVRRCWAERGDQYRAVRRALYAKNPAKFCKYNQSWRTANPARRLVMGAKKVAKARGLPFDLVPSELPLPEKCPVLGLPLYYDGRGRRPNSPSLDRIDNTKGYLRSNVHVISWRANKLKGDGTAEEHRHIAEYMENHE